MEKNRLLFALSAKSKNLRQKVKELFAKPAVMPILEVSVEIGPKESSPSPSMIGSSGFQRHSLSPAINPLMGFGAEQMLAQLKGVAEMYRDELAKRLGVTIANLYEYDFKNDR